MSKSLAGKYAVVTGGSRGIGAAIAIEFAKRGAAGIAITFVSNAIAAEDVVSQIKSYGSNAIAIKADASEPLSATAIVKQTQEAFSTTELDILVNNAAKFPIFPLSSITPELFHSTFATNLLGPIMLIQAIVPVIRRGGRIINISSRMARVPSLGGSYLYASSKAALENLTRNLALEWAAQKGITINNVMPGPTDTDALKGVPGAMVEQMKQTATAEKRLGRPEEIADIVAFMAEDGSKWINGDTICATGGATMF